MPQGRIIWHDPQTGYGTILNDSGRTICFDPEPTQQTSLAKGQTVSYRVALRNRTYAAVDVRPLVGAVSPPITSSLGTPEAKQVSSKVAGRNRQPRPRAYSTQRSRGPGAPLVAQLAHLGVPADLARRLSKREASQMVTRLHHSTERAQGRQQRGGGAYVLPAQGQTRKPGSHRASEW